MLTIRSRYLWDATISPSSASCMLWPGILDVYPTIDIIRHSSLNRAAVPRKQKKKKKANYTKVSFRATPTDVLTLNSWFTW